MPEASTYPGDLVLRAGQACAVLRPAAGGRVCSLTLARDDGRTVDMLFPYTAQGVDPLRWGKGGIYPLVPYSNRIANAQVQTPGGVVQLSPHPDAAPHSLHAPRTPVIGCRSGIDRASRSASSKQRGTSSAAAPAALPRQDVTAS